MTSELHKLRRSSVRWLILLIGTASLPACGDRPASEAGEQTAAQDHATSETDVVRLDSAALRVANIRTALVTTVASTGLRVTGTITYDANRVSHVGPRTDGRIVRMGADIGNRVRAGGILAILESPQIGQLRAEEHEAEALLKIARENYARERRLEQQGISSRKELLDAEADLRRAEAAIRSVTEKLRVLGATAHGTGGQYALTAPFDGVVVAREASLGEMASPADRIFTVANLIRVWIELDIYERDLSRVRPGQNVEVSTAAYPRRTFPGKIVYVGDIVDPQKRTVRARVEIPNTSGALRPGMFATALIQVGSAGPELVVVPQSAVQEVEGRNVVFVTGDQSGEFRALPIEIGEATEDGMITVLSGLKAGDTIVVTGAFALRSELAKGEIGEHGH